MPSTGIYLQNGDLRFGSGRKMLKAMVGSGVVVTAWHIGRRVGAMCRYSLPRRDDGKNGRPNGIYGDENLLGMVIGFHRRKVPACELEVGIFGGAGLFAEGAPELFNVGWRNVEIAHGFCQKIGVYPRHLHVGDRIHRLVTLDLAHGAVAVRKQNGETRRWSGN